VRGWKQAAEIADRAALLYRDGEVVGFENVAKYVTPELAYIVELERFRVKMGGRQDITPVTLRTTSIFRPEEGTWKVVHRHADPITTVQTPESVIQQ
jgi:ketosteroid isomerase-like protein